MPNEIPVLKDTEGISEALRQFLASPINRGNLLEEKDKIFGFYASAAEFIAIAEANTSLGKHRSEQIRDTFAQALTAREGKVSDAEIKRRVVRYDEFDANEQATIHAQMVETKFKGYAKGLEMRHSSLIALINMQSREMKHLAS